MKENEDGLEEDEVDEEGKKNDVKMYREDTKLVDIDERDEDFERFRLHCRCRHCRHCRHCRPHCRCPPCRLWP